MSATEELRTLGTEMVVMAEAPTTGATRAGPSEMQVIAATSWLPSMSSFV